MSVGKSERNTQDRVIELFHKELGYRFLGNWTDRVGSSNIEESLLAPWLQKSGYSPDQISRAIYLLRTEADNHNRSLYDNNQAVYNLLRYGVPVKTEAGKVTETVQLINWREPEKNDFVIVEEVTLKGGLERRPDLVLYINGIAIAVLELKNSRVTIGDGIRQSLSNQQPEFNQWFFSTIQFVFAGNDSEGLQYGSIGTPEKFFLKWKEDEQDDSRFKLDKYVLKLCHKARLLELIHDFVLFDGGVKKLPRVHQYFRVKAAQEHVRQRKGGIIWHTQGSGKSIVMVLLAKWILENNPNARVAIVTDRDELDKQIERVFREAGEPIKRTNSGRDLMTQLGQAKPRLLCSLVHKFGRRDVDDFDAFIKELEAQPSPTVGELFVFVDECHRTQGGKLHRVMTAMMPNAVFIGFTGTPLLKKDKATSLEVFGGYIHTYLDQERESEREYLERESHYVWGKRYLLSVIERDEPPSVLLKHSKLVLHVRPGTPEGKRQEIVEKWYRDLVNRTAPELIAKWEPRLGVQVARFYVQRMRTRWGSCNPLTASIRLNTDLAKKPRECLEYIIVHGRLQRRARLHC